MCIICIYIICIYKSYIEFIDWLLNPVKAHHRSSNMHNDEEGKTAYIWRLWQLAFGSLEVTKFLLYFRRGLALFTAGQGTDRLMGEKKAKVWSRLLVDNF